MKRNHEMSFYNYGKSLNAGSIVYTSLQDETDSKGPKLNNRVLDGEGEGSGK